METKKLSFGFSKVIKKSNLIPQSKLNNNYGDKKIELIKCIEDSSIKLIKENAEIQPLLIPMKNSTKTSAALASLNARKAVLENIEVDAPITDTKQSNPESLIDETLEGRAARELLQEVQKQQNIEAIDTSLVLPIKSDDKDLDGAKESNLDDYESIPVQQFGLAMLRGMGWKDDPNQKKKPIDIEGPLQRPKGMGLGADKAIKKMPLLVQPEENEKLEIKKTAYVRILAGKHKNLYGQIEGLDDHAGRVIIKLVIGGEKVSLNEFLVQPVSKAEFQKHGKIINSTKYEEYKKFENDQGQIVIPKYYNKSESSCSKEEIKQEHESRSEKYKSRRDNSPDEMREKSEIKKHSKNRTDDRSKSNAKYSSRDRYRQNSPEDSLNDRCSSESSESRHHHKAKKTKKKSKKIKKYYRNDSSEDEKKHKKKTKKSKRERSRSRSRSRTRK